MPPRGDFREQAQNSLRRSRELANKADNKELREILKIAPHVAGYCLEHLESLGYRDQEALGRMFSENKSDFTNAIAKRDREAKEALAKPHPSMSEFSHVPMDQQIPSRYWTLGSLSVHLLTDKVLHHLEPLIYSKANTRALVQRGESEGSKIVLTRIIEALTRLGADFSLQGQMRIWSFFLEFLMGEYVKYGKRASMIKLPPTWDGEDALWQLVVDEPTKAVHIQHRILGLKADLTSVLPDKVDLGSLYVDCPWSDLRAQVMSKQGGVKPIPVGSYLSLVDGESAGSNSKRPRLSLQEMPTPKVEEVPSTPQVKQGACGSTPLAGEDDGANSVPAVALVKPKSLFMDGTDSGEGKELGSPSGETVEPPAAAAAAAEDVDETGAVPPPPSA